MNWTVACFCGNVYTAPPNRCDECGCTFGEPVPGPTASAAEVRADDGLGGHLGHVEAKRPLLTLEAAASRQRAVLT
jgi:hypothetical protein